MEYKFQCPYCFQKIQCNKTNLNADCKCPHCHEVFLLDPDFIALEEISETIQTPPVIQNPIYKNNNLNVSKKSQKLICPKCGSSDIYYVQRGYDVLRGLIGCIFLPVIGLVLGLVGHTKLDCECTNCYYKSYIFKFKKDKNNVSYNFGTEILIAITFFICAFIIWKFILFR